MQLALVFSLLLAVPSLASVPSTTFSEEDRANIVNFIGSQPLDSNEAIFYASHALKLLNAPLPASACSNLKVDESNVVQSFYAISAASVLGCSDVSGSKPLAQKTLEIVEDSSNLADLFAASNLYILLAEAGKVKFDGEAFQPLVAHVEELKEKKGLYRLSDDADEGTYWASSLAWQVLAVAETKGKLGDDERLSIIASSEAVKDMLTAVQSKQSSLNSLSISDSSNVSPLHVTSSIIRSITSLSAALQDSLEVKPTEIGKLASFILNSKDAYKTLADAFYIVDALDALSQNTISVPLAVVIKNRELQQSSGSKGTVSVHVTDIYGNFATSAQVVAIRATKRGASAAVLSNQELFPVAKEATNTEYSFNFIASKPEPGLYDIEFSVSPQAEKFSRVSSVVRAVKVSTSAKIESFTLSLKEGGSETFSSDSNVRVSTSATDVLTFSVDIRSAVTGKSVKPHQVFVRLDSGDEEYYVVLTSSGKVHTGSVSARDLALALKSASASISLIVGDGNLVTPIVWSNVGSVSISIKIEAKESSKRYAALPEIHHEFRKPEKRPPQAVSSAFTLVILGLPAVLFISLVAIGFNLYGLPSGLGGIYSFAFIGCLGAIVFILFAFWTTLSIFDTLKLLGLLALPTAFVGNQALSAILHKRLQ